MTSQPISRAVVEQAIQDYTPDGRARAERCWPGPPQFFDRPFVLLGAGNAQAAHFLEHVAPQLNIVGVIDNYRIGETRLGLRVGGDGDLAELVRTVPNLVAINATPHPHFLAITKSLSVLSIYTPQIFEIFGLIQPEFGMRNMARAVLEDGDDFFRLAERMSDELSRQTLYRYMLYRLTADLHYLVEIARPWEHQFFTHSFLKYDDHEVIVDGGAYDGDTARFFLEASNGRYKRFYAFEPDPESFERLSQSATTARDIIPIRKGLSDRNDIVRFIADGHHGSRIANEGANSSIEVCRLDDEVKERVTYIKLDVEGAELAALQGARGVIARDAPRLGIAIYHKPEDAINISKFVQENCKNTRIYLRHHTQYHSDTTLFSVPLS